MSDIQKRIAEHNKQFKKAAPTFEPRHASLKEVKAWEQRTGLKYSELNHDQREAANKNIKGAGRLRWPPTRRRSITGAAGVELRASNCDCE